MPSKSGREAMSLPGETAADDRDQRDDQRLDVTKALVLQKQDDENIERGDADAGKKRNAEKQIERDGRADDLGQIAGGDREFADDPEAERNRPAVVIAAGLGQIAPGGDPEFE